MKKIISLFLVLSMAFCMLPAMNVSALGGDLRCTVDGITYLFRKLPGSTVVLNALETNIKNLVIPDQVVTTDATFTITGVDDNALKNNTNIESVKLNATCNSIGDFAFAGCTNLKTIKFNKTLRYIGQNAFSDTGLENLTLPDSVSTISNSSFANCKNLKTFTGGYFLETIGDNALNNCTSLTKVKLDACINKIGTNALGFNGTTKNPNVKFVIIRSSITATNYVKTNSFEYKFDISKTFIEGLKDKTYTGKAITQSPKVNDISVKLIKGVDYTFTTTNNVKPGYAKVTITGIGNYEGTNSETFFIKPVVAKVSKVKTSVKKQKLTVKWKKLSSISGYQINYAKKKNFSGKKTVTASKSSSSKLINKKLAKGKYYIRVRAYKTVAGRKTYGPYSNIVSKTVK